MTEFRLDNKSSQAYRRLKDLIKAGRFNAGQRLTEANAAKLLGMGRGPVRESLLRLETEGLLQHQGSRRSRVVAYAEDQNPEEILARYELREQIESGAARLAAKNMTGRQIDQLRELVQRLEEAWKSDDREARYEAGGEFHQFLLEHCGNPLMLKVWRSYNLTPVQPRSPKVEDKIFSGMPKVDQDRPALTEVVEAIAAHDPERAESLMKQRIRLITEAIRKVAWKLNDN